MICNAQLVHEVCVAEQCGKKGRGGRQNNRKREERKGVKLRTSTLKVEKYR